MARPCECDKFTVDDRGGFICDGGCFACWRYHKVLAFRVQCDLGFTSHYDAPPRNYADAANCCGGQVAVQNEVDTMTWTYGVTTVPERRKTLLPHTLASLSEAGFDRPHLFVDGEPDANSWRQEFDLDVTARWPRMQVVGNWVLALWELYARCPKSDRYAIFQDDVVAVKNLRYYLDSCELKHGTYWNLYTSEGNESHVIGKSGWVESKLIDDWFQVGKGALGIVLSNEGARTLLLAKGVVGKPLDAHTPTRNLDGMIVNGMNQMGWRELVHAPSLVQHNGQDGNVIGNPNPLTTISGNVVRQLAATFPGESFDAKELIAR